jgi:hypothetical protein
MWPHVLSVDVAVVFAAWTATFARSFHIPLHVGTVLVGGLCVWCIYVADHLLDGRGERVLITRRHQLAHRYRHTLIVFEVVAIGLSLAGPRRLSPVTLSAGMRFMVAVVLYFGIVLLGGERLRHFWPKKLVVATICAGACPMPAWRQTGRVPFALIGPVLLLALCVLNCAGLEYFEWVESAKHIPRPHPSTLWGGGHARGYGLGLAALCIPGFFIPWVLSKSEHLWHSRF